MIRGRLEVDKFQRARILYRLTTWADIDMRAQNRKLHRLYIDLNLLNRHEAARVDKSLDLIAF